jgi:hypothetical protein
MCHRATAGGWFRGVPERYVAGANTRGRPEGRPDPWSQQAIHEISGLGHSTMAAAATRAGNPRPYLPAASTAHIGRTGWRASRRGGLYPPEAVNARRLSGCRHVQIAQYGLRMPPFITLSSWICRRPGSTELKPAASLEEQGGTKNDKRAGPQDGILLNRYFGHFDHPCRRRDILCRDLKRTDPSRLPGRLLGLCRRLDHRMQGWCNVAD